jgi:two-component system phosphate regulon sensor histidine kinase PhoR
MWSSKIFRRVFGAFAILVAASAALFAVLVSRGQEAELRSQLAEQVRVSSLLLGELALEQFQHAGERNQEEAQRFQQRVHRLGQQTHTRMTVITADGRVLADSDFVKLDDVRQMEDHRHRPEIIAAMRDGFSFAERYSPTADELQYYFASRVDWEGKPLGVARASLPVRAIRGDIRRERLRVWAFSAIVATMTLGGTSYLLTRITTPLSTLTGAVERMRSGHLGEHVEITNQDEIGSLGQAFNSMSAELRERIGELRQRGDQLAAVLGGMVEGVIAVDRQARIMFANAAAGRQFDFQAGDAQGRPLSHVIRDGSLQQAVNKAMATGDVVTTEIERYAPNSAALAVHATPLPGSPCAGVVLVLYDVTRLRRLESLRQEFVANVSHELKTPLSSIKAYAETLRSGAIYDEEHNLEFLRRIEDQADRLNQLIMDLLSLARIESGEEAFEIEDIDVQSAVVACLEEYQQAATAGQIELGTEPPADPVVVRADHEAVRQILDNLIGNAIKYTPPGGRVTVRWCQQKTRGLIEVSDTGIGIESVHLDRLFERFYRVDKARSRELGGTGLGLSIVKHLTQFFGGTVGVRSVVGQGSTFWVQLPLGDTAFLAERK